MQKMAMTPKHSKVVDLTGKEYGRLKVISFSRLDHTSRSVWVCLCSCGTRKEISAASLRSGMAKSCGCYKREVASRTRRTHGLSKKGGAYNSWLSMKVRCLKPKSRAWPYYGGRGIKIFDGWINSFESFLSHVGERPGPEYSLDRIDVNGNYEPGNVRWATKLEQQRNKRKIKRARVIDIEAERDYWKERALSAEQKLRELSFDPRTP